MRVYMKNLKNINASNYCITCDGRLFSLRVNSFMEGWVLHGYRKYSVVFDDGTKKEMFAHRLVAFAYVDNPDPKTKTLVNHIDGYKLNNNKENLEWVTPSENNLHAYDTNLSNGKKNNNPDLPYLKGDYNESSITAELSEEDIHLVCKLIIEGYRDVDISRITNFGRRTINHIRHGDKPYLKKVSDQYNMNFSKEDRMSAEKVIEICELLQQGMKVMDISRKLNLNRKKVGNLRSRKTFKNISKNYKW